MIMYIKKGTYEIAKIIVKWMQRQTSRWSKNASIKQNVVLRGFVTSPLITKIHKTSYENFITSYLQYAQNNVDKRRLMIIYLYFSMSLSKWIWYSSIVLGENCNILNFLLNTTWFIHIKCGMKHLWMRKKHIQCHGRMGKIRRFTLF